jgi:hypothetical protein
MQAELKDWLTPKAVIAGTYAVVGIVGYCNLWKLYKKQCAFIEEKMKGEYAALDDCEKELQKIDGVVLEKKIEKNNADESVCILNKSQLMIKKVEVRFSYNLCKGSLAWKSEALFSLGCLPTKDTCRFEIYPQPWLKKIGYAYGVAGLGVLAYCGLTK